MTTEISCIELDIAIIQGRHLVAKDRNIFNKKVSSDPYVKVYVNGKYQGQTKVINKNLNPTWNEHFKVNFNTHESNQLFSVFKNGVKPIEYTLYIFDKDELSEDDDMGLVKGHIELSDGPTTRWMKVERAPGALKPVSGEIEIKTVVSVRKMLTAVRGNSLVLGTGRIGVQLDWKLEDMSVDLDTSCVAVDRYGKILMDETVYFGDLVNSNASIAHSGDVQYGGGKGENITCDLSRIRDCVKALYFILTVATAEKTFENVKSASVTVVNQLTQCNLCKFTPSLVGSNTAMFLMRLLRSNDGRGWTMQIIEDTDRTARDFGTLIPEIKGYCRDFCPEIDVNPRDRIAIMRKGGAMRLMDYSSPHQPIPVKMTFGLAWDITNGRNVDLDASAILLDSRYAVVDIVFFRKLISDDNAIIHGGDEREGDEIGDDEKIFLYLQRLNPSVAYIAFVINSFSGQELDDVNKAKCHLFNSNTGIDIASYTLTNNQALDKHTGLLMSVLFKDDSGSWCMRIISKPCQGKVAKDLVPTLQRFLKNSPPAAIQVVPEPEVIVNEMPEDVEIMVEPVIPSHEFIPSTLAGDWTGNNTVVVPSLGGPTHKKSPNNGVFVPQY